MTENLSGNVTPDADISSASIAPFSVGTALREARVHLGLSVDEASHRIKFAPRQIEALEADDFAHLPEAAFLRGFVRSYARLVQLDPAALLAALPHAPAESAPLEAKALTEVPYPDIYTERKYNIIWLAAALAIAIALALAAWLLGGESEDRAAPETTVSGTTASEAVPTSTQDAATIETLPLPAAAPVATLSEAEMNKTEAAPTPPKAPATDAAKQADIRLVFDGDSLVEITDKNGKILHSQLNRAGTELGVNGTPPFSLVIGNSRSVHLYYKEKAVDLAQHTQIAVARLTLE